MTSRNALRRWWRRGLKLERPIFILGCKRSGTTILGRTIGAHRQVTYLNEPKKTWAAAFPQSDIYTDASGHVVLDEKDWTEQGADRLCSGFSEALHFGKGTRLCEKTPINSFRGPLLNRIFPDALYVLIEREPLAVAKSVAARGRYSANDNANNSKWLRISSLAELTSETRGLSDKCETILQKMLLEWILCTIFARTFLFAGPIPANRVLRIQYERFTQDPGGHLTTIEFFRGPATRRQGNGMGVQGRAPCPAGAIARR